MSDTLYLQLDQNIQINHPHIYLQDIAKLSCSNSKILNRLRVMPVINLDPNKPGRYVDVGGLFSQIYTQVTGQTSGHFTVLEITYSIGIGLGVLFFFNHFGHMKITDDPTPMQIQMRLYEENVNKTLIKDIDRTSEK